MGRVRWLEPVERRRRRRAAGRADPALLVSARRGGAAPAGAARARGRRRPPPGGRRALHRRLGARRLPAMWRSSRPSAAGTGRWREFAASYRIAAEEATVKAVRPGPVARAGEDRARARDGPHARLRRAARHDRPAGRRARRRGLPGLVAGVAAARAARGRERPAPRAAAARAAADPRRRRQPAGGRAAAAGCGTAPAGGEPGSGLQALYDQRLGGRPGAELRFGARIVKRVDGQARPRAAHDDLAAACSGPRPRRSAAALGGVGDHAAAHGRRARRWRASPLSGPQPPGSTFKIITLAGALQARHREPVEQLSRADRRDAVRRAAAQRERRVVRRLAGHLVRALLQLRVRAAGRQARRASGSSGCPRRSASTRSRSCPARSPARSPRARAEGRPRRGGGRDRPGARPRHRAADGLRRGDDRQPRRAGAPADRRAERAGAPPRGQPPRRRPGARHDGRRGARRHRRRRGASPASRSPARPAPPSCARPPAARSTRRTPTRGSSPSRPRRSRASRWR